MNQQHGHISLLFKWVDNIAGVDRHQWNRLAVPLSTPILEWEWLYGLESSGSISADNGWVPAHLIVQSEHRLMAAAPLYIKTHSAGEFVFDHIWAQAAHQMNIPYYPKLVGMSPATPTVGYRFLVDPDVDETRLTHLMLDEIERFCKANRIFSFNILFADPGWRKILQGRGFIPWLHQSFLWENPGHGSFDDFLVRFNTNQRRNIKRERKALASEGIDVQIHTGNDIGPELFDVMYDYYENTNDKFGVWGCKYLNKAFFSGLYESFRHRLMVVAGYRKPVADKVPVGMSLLLQKKDTLIGRYWGSSGYYNALHFNACYYAPLEWAIRHGIRYFDPGAGSTHKIRRGFRAVGNYSYHQLFDPRLQWIMASYIDDINKMERTQINHLNSRAPYARKTG
ncbi:MAG: GNAT family N-acetyltransferase [Desulfobacteraceae bacterium]|nr:GNAT family N-acetyltransferase [Desulfobacteraceae bacterium]